MILYYFIYIILIYLFYYENYNIIYDTTFLTKYNKLVNPIIYNFDDTLVLDIYYFNNDKLDKYIDKTEQKIEFYQNKINKLNNYENDYNQIILKSSINGYTRFDINKIKNIKDEIKKLGFDNDYFIKIYKTRLDLLNHYKENIKNY